MQTPSNITLNKSKTILILTFNNTKYPLSAEYLRVYSPSAEVVGHGSGQEILQVGKENITITRIEPTGNYAIVLFFSDSHDSGIYSWEYLYKLAIEQDKLWSDYLAKLKDSGHSHKQH